MTPEQTDRLRLYVDLLKKWQKTINLVGKNTLEDAWDRHILDSAQLSAHIPQHATLLDIGSGAGFPGLVLAILRPDISVTLVESDTRKCVFMQTVARETHCGNVTVLNDRVESVSPQVAYDVISARALASLENLLTLSAPFRTKNPALFCLFLKGKSAEEELSAAQNRFSFEITKYPSHTNPDACLLHLSRIESC
ncbi:MAG: 16S rRNA (guanine(527)-N(7))-methyltransferase RsmG [Rhodospirillales bacterium]|nr:16S rRNA (guanine(527)-N(7))-methyltransferase RsmG [Rhodospirillales bacterium]MCB9964692.1 16S rRNA (guanine(527)-N(7))-methyltransferase RsmG [Rhodospirillales bacterium]MCB9979982.1 16S rRNA (guanine(527)-N(7))-methyltransferase RsmG [Rhodospirillales bacterium]